MISIVIPAYNESANIKVTLQHVAQALLKTEYANGYEIIVVDDHSSDDTFDQVHRSGVKGARCIRLSHRAGSHTALRAGFRESKGDAAICLSADGQDDPNTIPRLIERWKAGGRIIWALRMDRDNEPFLSKFMAQLFYRILASFTRHMPSHIDLSRADFYLLDRSVVDAINSCHERNTSLFGLVVWTGFPQDYIEYNRPNRRSGSSKWNFSSRMNLAKDWIIAFSGVPLRFMTWLGTGICIFGLLYALMIIFLHFTSNSAVEGWSSLMVAVLVLGGLNIAMGGLMENTSGEI